MTTTPLHKMSRAQQLAQTLRRHLEQGRWKQGSRLPPVRSLAREYQVSINTAQAAVQSLAEAGLIELRPRKGAYVQAGGPLQSRTSLPSSEKQQIGLVSPITRGDTEDIWIRAVERVNEDTQSWGNHILNSASHELHREGFRLVTLPYRVDGPDPAGELISRVREMRHDLAGVIGLAGYVFPPFLATLDEYHIPWLTVGQQANRNPFNFVAADLRSASQRVGQCLLAMDVERVWFLATQRTIRISVIDNISGLFHAYWEAGRPTTGIEVLDCQDVREKAGYEAVKRQLTRADLPQAIMAMGDLLAIGGMRAIQDHGANVPGDVQVVGSTGLSVASYTNPPLSGVAQPMTMIGRQLAATITQMIRQRTTRVVGRLIPCPMIFRQTMTPCPDMQARMESLYQEEVATYLARHQVSTSMATSPN